MTHPHAGRDGGTRQDVPPRPVRIASVLWTAFGVLLAVGTIGLLANPMAGSIHPAAIAIVLGAAVAVAVLGVAMLRGAGNWVRITLTVLGGLFALGLWPLLLVGPAIVLQFLRASNAWFHAPADSTPTAPTRQRNRPPEDWDEEDERYWHSRGTDDRLP